MAEAIAIDIGKSLAIEAAKALTQLVGARPLEEIRFAWGFKDQLRTLNRKFGYIRAFLEDLGSAKSEQKVQLVNLWLQHVKDLVYSAEDFMDEYANEILRKKLEQYNGSRKQFRSVFKRSNRIRFRFRMTHKVGEILAKFDELEKEAQNLGLKPVKIVEKALALTYNDNMDQHLQQVREHADADASEFVGRKHDEEKLVQLLCSPPPPSNKDYGLSINAIVGIGGIGKTTLARRLYTNDQVVQQFSKLFWICVSDDFNITRLLKKLSEFLTSKCELSSTDAIIAQIHRELNGSKFLLVLDDVWNNNVDLWDSLKRSLQKIGGLPGSAILLTTRSSEVATKAGAVYPHLLTKLSEESWTLFKQHFNTSETLLNIPCFEDVGRRIVEKCKGVPLAIKMIGRTMQSKKELYEWETIEKSDLWHLEQDNILPWLKLSFYHLPSLSLKQCFAYCAIFPKDCSMERGDLIALWLAQGFLHKPETSNSTMEEIGEGILEILMQNLFLQGEESEKTGRILSYRMHDLVHDLAVYVSRKDLLVWKEEAKPNSAIGCRHLVGRFRMKQAVPEFPAEIYPQKLRTINLWAGFLRNLSEARYLHTLIIDDIGLEIVPTAIGQLKLLRYLDLSNNPIKSIPDSITKLYQLQTLKLTGCKELTELPTEMHRLVNLRHILTADQCLFASKGLQQLTCLQTLPSLALRNEEGWTMEELGFLHEAKDGLSISGLEHVKSEAEARKTGLAKKGKLLRLHFVWSANRVASSSSSSSNISTDEEVLTGLEPHPGIISLALVNYNVKKFPLWIMRMAVRYGEPRKKLSPLGNLKAIKLVDCKRCRQLPTLGQLPFLKYLYVDTLAVESIDEDFYVSDQDPYKPREQLFPTLRELQIWNLPKLIEWKKPPPTIQATSFPCLEILEVMNCPLLNTIPALTFKSLTRLRIQELAGTQSLDIVRSSSNLTSLEVCDIGKMTSLPKEVSNYTNLQKLNIWSCKELVSLPSGLRLPVSLKTLDIRQCPAMVSLPDDLFQGLSSLYKLNIFRCKELKRILTSLQGCISLKELCIKHCPLIEAPLPDLKMLQGLEELGVVDAGNLTTSILEALKHLPRLTELDIGGFKDEQEFLINFMDMSPFLRNPSLGITRLMLEGTPNVKSLPEQIQLFSAIQFLGIKEFDELEEVPDWISKLSSLEELWLSECKNLKLLPSKQIIQPLTEFWHLGIDNCPLLTKGYTKDGGPGGPEWDNISHLSFIEFDGKTVQVKERR